MQKSPISLCFELSRSSKKSQNLTNGNEMISSNDNLFFHVKKELTAHLRAMSSNEVKMIVGSIPEGSPLFTPENPCFIIVKVAPPTNRRMDTPNWYPTVKALMDGLSDAHVFSDDNDDVITSMTFLREPKAVNKKYRLTIEVHPGQLGGLLNA